MRRYLRDPMFSCFDTIPECDRHTHTETDRQTDRHTTTAYTTLSIASRDKNIHKLLRVARFGKKVPTRLLLAASGTIKFVFGTLLLLGLLYRTPHVCLNNFSAIRCQNTQSVRIKYYTYLLQFFAFLLRWLSYELLIMYFN